MIYDNSTYMLTTRITAFSFVLIFATSIVNCQDKNSSFKPGQIWPDNEGKHINAHGGAILFHDGTYYWFGETRLPRQEKDRTRYGVGWERKMRSSIWATDGYLKISPTAVTSGFPWSGRMAIR